MATRLAPRVSIGLPVYNGDNYLAATLESLLAQSYTDFELIVSDNASTDRTAEICQAYASRDRRLRYVRNERNIGAAANYNRTFELATGELFKWHAHDDLLALTCIEKCVAVLDANPDAVLCQSWVEYIDEHGQSLGVYDNLLPHADALRPSTRFAAAILVPHSCTDFFGLARRTALVGTMLHADFHGADRALIAQLALRGRLLKVNEPLFLNRDHPMRYTRTANRPQDRQLWHAGHVQSRHYPIWRLYREYWQMIPRDLTDRRERLRCYGHLLRWWQVNWNWARMAVDVLAVLNPDIVERAQRAKQRIFDPEPGPGSVKPRQHITLR
jgi:glycosyltransferase involved in cell wall biosynthesis